MVPSQTDHGNFDPQASIVFYGAVSAEATIPFLCGCMPVLWVLYQDSQYETDRSSLTDSDSALGYSLKLACLAEQLANADYAVTVSWNRYFTLLALHTV